MITKSKIEINIYFLTKKYKGGGNNKWELIE